MVSDSLPHRHPFRLVDQRSDGTVVVRLTAGGPLLRGDRTLPPTYAIEILAEAAIFMFSGDEAVENAEVMYLAGIDRATFHDSLSRQPLATGDSLEMELITIGSALGRMRKLQGTMRRAGETVVEAGLILVAGD